MPIMPSPSGVWRSTRLPRIFIASFRCMPFRYPNPTTRSSSANVASHASRVRRSYPAAKAWQVSMQTPTRDLSSTRSIR